MILPGRQSPDATVFRKLNLSVDGKNQPGSAGEPGSHGGLKLQLCLESSLKSPSVYFPLFPLSIFFNLRITLFFFPSRIFFLGGFGCI